MEPFGLPEILLVAFLLILGLGASRLPSLIEGLEEAIREFRLSLFGELPLRPADQSDHCARATGFRCRSCGRLTRKGSYLLLSGLMALSTLAVGWHFWVPVL